MCVIFGIFFFCLTDTNIVLFYWQASLSDVVYEAQGEEPLLFCYKKHRRRCVRLRAYHSSWSSAFSLDTVGCTGLVVCKDRERKRRYRILLTVILSKLCPHLTRIVTLLPNFLVVNDTKKHLRFMEENERADLWIDLAPGQVSVQNSDSGNILVYDCGLVGRFRQAASVDLWCRIYWSYINRSTYGSNQWNIPRNFLHDST